MRLKGKSSLIEGIGDSLKLDEQMTLDKTF
jgi:hypothetical protein